MAINYAPFVGLTPQQVYAQFANGLPVGWDWNAWQAAQPAGTPDYTATPDNSAFGGVDPWSQQFFEDTKVPLGNVPPPVTVTTGAGTPGSAPGGPGGQFDRNAFNAVIGGALGTRQRQPSMIFSPNNDYVRTASGTGYVDTTGTTPPPGGSSTGSYITTTPGKGDAEFTTKPEMTGTVPTKYPTYDETNSVPSYSHGSTGTFQNKMTIAEGFSPPTNPVIPRPIFAPPTQGPRNGRGGVVDAMMGRRSRWNSYS